MNAKARVAAATAAAMLLLGGSAHAQGGAPAVDWSGPYVGVNGGYAWSHADWNNSSDPNGPFFGDVFNFGKEDDGFLAGGHAGYNFQFGRVVLGIEGSFDYVDIDHSARVPGVADDTTLRTTQRWLGTVGPRLGYSVDRALLYGTIGAAFTRYKFSDDACCVAGHYAVSYPSKTWAGWTVGLGGEYAITDNIVAGLDYKHYEFGGTTVASGLLTGTGPPAGPGFDLMHVNETEDVLTARISYKFGAF